MTWMCRRRLGKLRCAVVQECIANEQEASREAVLQCGAGGQLDSAAGTALTPDWVLDVHSVAGAQVSWALPGTS
eukprot:1156647-Pelagomonas_calceolata.AAC.6